MLGVTLSGLSSHRSVEATRSSTYWLTFCSLNAHRNTWCFSAHVPLSTTSLEPLMR